MKLLYPHEHVNCYNYEKGDRIAIEKITLEKGCKWKLSSNENKIICMLTGVLNVSFSQFMDRVHDAGKMLLVPAGNSISGYTENGCTFIVIRLHDTKRLCDCFSLDLLLAEKSDDYKPDLYFLDINERVRSYLSYLDVCISDGLKCTFFLKLKMQELFFLLRAYYTKEDLLRFFYLLLSNDISFSDFVIQNHYKVKNVQELAEMSHYSLSGFQKRFKKAFGVSPYQWMKDERSKAIFHQINSTAKSFKEISDEYGFSSPSHFNDFCKTHFGTTPGKIRKNSGKGAK